MKLRMLLPVWLAGAVLTIMTACAEEPLFSFGIVADVQYAERPNAGARRYSESVAKLAKAVEEWNRRAVVFAVELGDLSDDREAATTQDLARVVATAHALRVPFHHVLGNHGQSSLGREAYLRAVGMAQPYYDFVHAGWRFIVLDDFGFATVGRPQADPLRREAEKHLKAGKDARHPQFVAWGGAVDAAQMAWLKERLALAEQNGEKVVLLSHLPTHPQAGGPAEVLWNWEEVLAVLEGSPAVTTFFAGHQHRGGYYLTNGIHHVTLKGMVEAPADGNSFGIVHVFPDRLELEGLGMQPSRILPARRPSPAKEPEGITGAP
jgi:3',5'-cyclic AMP phosphodiesterase CpdA